MNTYILQNNNKILASEYEPSMYVPASIYQFKLNNGNKRSICRICWKLTLTTPKWGHWRHSGVFPVNIEQILYIVLLFPLFTSEQVNADWGVKKVIQTLKEWQ